MTHKRFFVAVAVLLTFSNLAHAQGANSGGQDNIRRHSGQGYFFFAPGVITGGGSSEGTMHFGGGFDIFAYKGLGFGGEAGYLAPWDYLSDGMGLASVNGSYHFRRNSKVTPFVTAGYSIGFRTDHVDLVNFGGGLNYWFSDRVGMRLEFRDHLHSTSYANWHYVGFRVGLSLR